MNDNGIFRKAALDRLSSPEQLDRLLPVTDRQGWLALAACLLVMVTAVIWSLVGSVPRTVAGVGMLVTAGGLAEVIPPAGGQVLEIVVRVGDAVSEGQLVARMAQPELKSRLDQAGTSLEHLLDQHEETQVLSDRDATLKRAQLEQRRLAVRKAIDSARMLARALEQKLRDQARLLEAGLLLNETFLETRQRRDSAEQRIEEGQSELAEIAVQQAELGSRRTTDRSAGDHKIDEERRIVADLRRELAAKTEIVASQAGRVLEILAEPGAVLGSGEPVLTLGDPEERADSLAAVLFVPSQQGKQIQVGMQVLVAPSTVKREEFGMILARVTSVSDFPATVRGMRRILKNDKLVASLAGQDAPYEIRAELLPDPTTVSRYRWSSSSGPPRPIESGTMIAADVAIEARRPIELVLPLMREQTGL